jgi:hypothetical protein
VKGSVLRLFVPEVQRSYSGRLYFILGPGLGDTVNDFRIVHEVMALFPSATPVVYADPRWKDLYPLVPDLEGVPIRFHAPAPSGERLEKEKQYPYHRIFQGIVQEISSDGAGSPQLVALAGFKWPDQLARKESSLGMKARAIGLELAPSRCRPYLPIGADALGQARRYLDSQGLSSGRYVVVAPHTFPDKMWSHEAWESLIEGLHSSTDLPLLVLGIPGYRAFRDSQVREALGLPLPLVAGLLSLARCFIGLDSGPTHLAACFDVPIVTLNPQGKFPPFLVEAQSPYRWTLLTPGLYGTKPILPDSVLEVVRRALAQPGPSLCPLCQEVPYVLGANKDHLLYLSGCGLIFRDHNVAPVGGTIRDDWGEPIGLPLTGRELEALRGRLTELSDGGLPRKDTTVTLSVEHWDPLETDATRLLSAPSAQDLWWTWDAAFYLVAQCGWRVVKTRLFQPTERGGAAYRIELRVVRASDIRHDPILEIPWGHAVLRVRQKTYEGWLSWGAFRKQDELEGIGWLLAQEGQYKEGREILRLALTLCPRLNTLCRLLRVWWMGASAS